MKTNHALRVASSIPPPSGRKAKLNIAPLDVEGLIDELKNYHSLYCSLFQRQEQRHWSLKYMEGQLLAVERKSIEPMAIHLNGGNIQAMQQYISDSPWDDEPILKVHQQEVFKTLGEPDGILILDGSDFPKQGQHSVGVSYQHCGALGKTANCQAGVFLGYSSQRGHTLLDRRLFLPEKWFSAEFTELRDKCEVPEDLSFQTKTELGWSMLAPLLEQERLPFQWITMDEGFGRATHLLDKIDSKNKYYFAEIPCDTRVWLRRPKTVLPKRQSKGGRPATKLRLSPDSPASKRVDEVAITLTGSRWRHAIIQQGSKGPLEVEVAVLRVVTSRANLPARDEWLVVRRKSANQPISGWKFYRCNAPADTDWKTLAGLTAGRWPIETTFEEAKGQLGMDNYEVRNWRGWHHHMTMTLLSHHFLVRLRVKMGNDAPALTIAQVRKLLQVTLPKRTFDAQNVLDEINRIQTQNYAAYCSHSKRNRKSKHPT